MRILIVTQGPWGERIARNVAERSPDQWTVSSSALTKALPPLIDEPEEFLPSILPNCDLLLFLSETEQSPQLIPDIVEITGARAVIAPIDNSHWVPQGLKNQIERELAAKGIGSAWPKTFCTLTEQSYGYRHAAQSYDHNLIAEFAKIFGKPKFDVTVDSETGLIENVVVIRGAPCGSSHHTAIGLAGTHVDEAIPRAGLLCHHFPCQASMQAEQIDKILYDTLMHLSGYVVNEDIEERIKPYKTPPRYMTPPEI